MFAKTIISLGFLFLMLFGLIVAIRDQQYTMFTIGIVGYLLVAIAPNLCKSSRKLF
jgi:hypothetical protein